MINNIDKLFVEKIKEKIKEECGLCYLHFSQNCKCLENCNFRPHPGDRVTIEFTSPVYRFKIVDGELYVTLENASIYYIIWCIRKNLKYFPDLNSLGIDIHHLFQNIYDSILTKAVFKPDHSEEKHTNNCTGLDISSFIKVMDNMFTNLCKKYQNCFNQKIEKDKFENLFLDFLFMSKSRREKKSKELYKLNNIKESTRSFLNDYKAIDIQAKKIEDLIKLYNKEIKYLDKNFIIKEKNGTLLKTQYLAGRDYWAKYQQAIAEVG